MLILILLVILLFFAFFFPRNRKTLIISVLLVIIILGIRWNSGTDFYLYLNYYEDLNNSFFKYFNRIDFGYFILSSSFSYLGIHFVFFQLFCMLISWFLYYRGIIYFKGSPHTVLLFLFVITIGLLGSNRQWFAMALVFYGSTFLLKRQVPLFLFFLGIAAIFHVSALIALPFIFIYHPLKRTTWYFLSFLMLLLLFSGELLSSVLWNYRDFLGKIYGSKVRAYLEDNSTYKMNYFYMFAGIIRRLVPLVILLYYKNLKKYEGWNFLLNISIFSMVLYLFCVFNFQFLLGRLTVYYSLFDAVVFGWLATLYYSEGKNSRYLGLLAIWALLIFFKSIMPYPHLFIPYKTIFFTI